MKGGLLGAGNQKPIVIIVVLQDFCFPVFLLENILNLIGKVFVQFQIKAAIFCKILLCKLLNAAVHLVKIVGEKRLPGFEISDLWFERFLFLRSNIRLVGNNKIQWRSFFYGSL